MTELWIAPWSKRRTAVWLVLSLCVVVWILAGAGLARAQQAPQPPKVGTEPVKAQNVAETAGFTGRVQAINRVEILPRVSGFLLSLGFKEGSAVSKGQTLFEIEPNAYQAAITQIKGQIKAAQASKTLADIEVARQQKLVSDQVSAENVLQEAQAKQGQAEGALEQLQGELENAQLNLSYTTITAPFDGRVGLTDMSVGAYISQATGTMVTLSSIDPIYVTFPVSEAVMLNFGGMEEAEPGGLQPAAPAGSTSDATADTGTTTDSSGGASTNSTSAATANSAAGGTSDAADSKTAAPHIPLSVSLTLANGKDYDKTGRITVVDTQVQEGTDTILVRASFPNPKGILRDGQLVRVTVTHDTENTSLTIPAQALQRDQGGYFVLVVGADNKVEKRPITFGRMVGTEAVVTGGLKAGEQVITDGVQRARPGEAVAPQPASAQPSDASTPDSTPAPSE
ncbi:efflux RND transporter periplasmic adaptor subunit [Chachezhania antarctica]|uniref:efflux RND transporter periplasmic adaptor subunit n=1 Tax=Chachezhania antarctica TaxID=2340860 RepID=UPI000EAC0DF5|nr:efflux RND transporter periplasmic adaptor subunit [Chachezhania antarctica]|tara:strand:+ start:2982 stop:4343 length:1362 start_codon:yes stop_codon:yes gene_type:complete